jgi:hypothetical protein
MPTISRAIWRCIGKSSELLLVVDSEQLNGWQQLHDSYLNGYPDRNAMGFIEPKRIQVKLLKPDLALALIWWSVSFPSSKQKVVGNSTMNFHTPQLHLRCICRHSAGSTSIKPAITTGTHRRGLANPTPNDEYALA